MERVEEYLEAIYDIQEIEKRVAKTSDLAKKLNIKPSSVTEMLAKLSDKGYIEYQPYYGATLTQKGEEVAKRIKKYYRIFIKFFRDFLGVDEGEAKKLSCELEHHVSDEIVEKICKLISTECDICEECNYETRKLSEIKSGKYRVIIAPKGIEKMGIKPGKIIEVKEKYIEVDGEKFDVSEKLKSKVLVEKIEREINERQ